MKQLLTILILISSLSITAQTKVYKLDTKQSTIQWKGHYMFKMAEHHGDVKFKSGKLLTQSGNITGGTFVVNMNTINNEENRTKGHGPVKHLKNADFFNVPKFPEATLIITKVDFFEVDNSHHFYADMTIKGITKSIRVQAYVDDAAQTIKIQFKIDRTRWGINYNSKLKDDSISEAIEFDVHLQF